jgi:hypothetical protein
MGREAKHTTITIDGEAHTGDVLLETDEVLVRVVGESKRRRLKVAALKKVRGAGTSLTFDHDGAHWAIEVASAARWAEKIVSPPSLLDKLGIAKASGVHVTGLDDEPEFQKALKGIPLVPLGPKASVVVVGITTRAQLSIVERARRTVGDAIALWVVYPRGKKELSEDHIRAAAIAAGLVDVKVARFSDVRSALKLVVRKSERAR